MVDLLDQFFRYIDSKKKLSREARFQLRLHIVVEKIPKNACLLQYGAMSDKMYFICTGSMRGETREMEDGEWVYKSSRFMFEQEIVFNVESFDDYKPSEETIYTLESVVALTITRDEFDALVAVFPEIDGLVRKLAFDVIKLDNKRFRGIQSPDVVKRVKYLIAHEPVWMQKVPHKYLASYVFTTPEHFSRIMKKLRGGK